MGRMDEMVNHSVGSSCMSELGCCNGLGTLMRERRRALRQEFPMDRDMSRVDAGRAQAGEMRCTSYGLALTRNGMN